METPRVFQSVFTMLALVVLGCFVTGTVLPKSFLIGYNDTHGVENVVVENLQFNGRRILNAEAGNFMIEKARGVRLVESRN